MLNHPFQTQLKSYPNHEILIRPLFDGVKDENTPSYRFKIGEVIEMETDLWLTNERFNEIGELTISEGNKWSFSKSAVFSDLQIKEIVNIVITTNIILS